MKYLSMLGIADLVAVAILVKIMALGPTSSADAATVICAILASVLLKVVDAHVKVTAPNPDYCSFKHFR